MYTYCIDIFGCPIERTNVNGGAIALGTSFLLLPALSLADASAL